MLTTVPGRFVSRPARRSSTAENRLVSPLRRRSSWPARAPHSATSSAISPATDGLFERARACGRFTATSCARVDRHRVQLHHRLHRERLRFDPSSAPTWTPHSLNISKWAPMMGDFDGDGRTDVLMAGTSIELPADLAGERRQHAVRIAWPATQRPTCTAAVTGLGSVVPVVQPPKASWAISAAMAGRLLRPTLVPLAWGTKVCLSTGAGTVDCQDYSFSNFTLSAPFVADASMAMAAPIRFKDGDVPDRQRHARLHHGVDVSTVGTNGWGRYSPTSAAMRASILASTTSRPASGA